MTLYATIYGSPEKWGLRIFAVLAAPEDYSFDLLVVWADREGRLWFATDSGCSCPEPFEDHGLEDLTEITGATFSGFLEAVRDHPSGDPADKPQLLAKVAFELACATR